MSATEQQSDLSEQKKRQRRGLWPRRWRFRISLALLFMIAAGLLAAWIQRERIAIGLISDQLAANGIEATYDIVSVDAQRQVIANLVIGDPDAPDFTAERIMIDLEYGFGAPGIERVEIVAPRLFGTYRKGQLSFGSLDPLVFPESEQPPSLPALDIAIVDGRALIDSDYGAMAAKIDGAGKLDDGFSGTLAATAPGLTFSGCSAQSATLYGNISTTGGVPAFDGPVRLRQARCADMTLERADLGVDLALTDDLAGVGGGMTLTAGELLYAGTKAASVAGEIDLNWGENGLNLRHDLRARNLFSEHGRLGELRADGLLRSDAEFARSDWTADISGERVQIAGDISTMLGTVRSAGADTLIAGLLAKFERNFTRTAANGRMRGSVTVRQSGNGVTLAIPEGRFTGAGGDRVLAISRVSWVSADAGTRLSGNFVTGGRGLPRINGRMEQEPGGELALRVAMSEYAEGGDQLAIPRMKLVQGRDGGITFNGIVTASGAIPNGTVAGLRLPIEGSWNASRGLAVGRKCTEIGFKSLVLSELSLNGRSLAMCPAPGGVMVRYDEALRIAIETRDLALDAKLAGSPTVIAASAASFNYPGNFALSDVLLTIGTQGSAVRLTASELIGGMNKEIGGTFTGATAQMDIVPLDLTEMAGRWAYHDERLILDQGAFLLTERVDGVEVLQARFEPLIATDATLTLAQNDITAQADLLHPGTMRLVTSVDVEHDLTSGLGRAGIVVPALTFDDRLRPRDITYLTQGVVAFANGTITGTGDIRWTSDTITSTGTFETEKLDLAAAFGPIGGLRGTIEFIDLINLTTAPGQVLEIGSINPGIEVLAGQVRYSLTNGEVIAIEDARWPFMGGELILRPVTITYGEPGPQRYVFEIIALDAEIFIAQMELSNLGARGVFDGAVPIVFDDKGNGSIERGLLISRPPGGNVSYIGELTYEDMGAMANFAFQSLRSLDYRQMSIGLEGSLAGEIVTAFKIDGVRQGEGASSNFVTRRLAKLPIRFDINVRSQNFYQLATMVRSFYDTKYLGNPVDRGLLQARDGRFVPASPFVEPQPDKSPDNSDQPATGDARRDDESSVQLPESDNRP